MMYSCVVIKRVYYNNVQRHTTAFCLLFATVLGGVLPQHDIDELILILVSYLFFDRLSPSR